MKNKLDDHVLKASIKCLKNIISHLISEDKKNFRSKVEDSVMRMLYDINGLTKKDFTIDMLLIHGAMITTTTKNEQIILIPCHLFPALQKNEIVISVHGQRHIIGKEDSILNTIEGCSIYGYYLKDFEEV